MDESRRKFLKSGLTGGVVGMALPVLKIFSVKETPHEKPENTVNTDVKNPGDKPVRGF